MPKSTAILSARGGMSIIKHLQCWTCVFPLQKSLNFSPIQLEMKSLGPKNTYWLLIFHCLFTTTSEYQGKKCSRSSRLHRLEQIKNSWSQSFFWTKLLLLFPFSKRNEKQWWKFFQGNKISTNSGANSQWKLLMKLPEIMDIWYHSYSCDIFNDKW